VHHCSLRSAFGARLIEQPLMKNVLADLVLEQEGALTLALRMAHAMDARATNEQEDLLVRLAVPVGKYWICKRTPGHAYEAMECIGGSGVMEDCMMPRLFRESPVNAIWEGSGNVQCLDVLRAMSKTPDAVDAFLAEVGRARGADSALDAHVSALARDLCRPAELDFRARDIVDRMAVAIQAALLLQHAPAAVSSAFCASRLSATGHHNFGALPSSTDCDAILRRSWPSLG
jgi:putative acyl-CoA dehydrogenase